MITTRKRPTLAALDKLDVFDTTVSERKRLARLTAVLLIEISELQTERDEWRARAEAAGAELAQADGRRK